jgi:hypothetical protein
MKKSKQLFFLLLTVSLFFGCLTTTVDDEDIIYNIQIRIMESIADEDFRQLRIREVGTTTWIINQRFEHTQGTHQINLTPTLEQNINYEIQLETTDSRTATIITPLSQNSIVVFERRHFNDETAVDISIIYIRNLTGTNFGYFSIRRSGVESWLFDRVIQIQNEMTISIAHISPPLKTTERYDIHLREHATGGISATRNDILLSHNGVIIFRDVNLDE